MSPAIGRSHRASGIRGWGFTMTHTDNRSRLSIDPDGAWRLYAGADWPGPVWTMHGTVTRGIGDTGALALSPAGKWCQVNAGAVRSLDPRKVAYALSGQVTDIRNLPSGVWGTAHRGADRFDVLLDRVEPVWRAVNSGSTLPCEPEHWRRLNAARV